MQPTELEGYISIIASNFAFPIASLFESLDSLEEHPPNEVQASPLENGYSLAIITLTVLMVESAISRTQYRMKVSPPLKAIQFVEREFPVDLYQKVEEIFVVRDAIVHNHIGEANVYWDENWKLKLVDAQRVPGYGDKKYEKVVDTNTRATKILAINVFPNRICRSDALTVLKTAFEFLSEVQAKDQNYFSLSAIVVKYLGRVMPFEDFVSKVTK